MNHLFEPLHFSSGRTMKNRFMLAPMTNQQSHEHGGLSEEEFKWLSMRAQGGFGMTMTCAVHVQSQGKGFPKQLGLFSDDQLEGHQRLASAISASDSLGIVQLHHAGTRSPRHLISGQPLGPSVDLKTGARALTQGEVCELRDDFIRAAQRAERAGYDGVELHGAHAYLLCQFLSARTNQRADEYGGSLENRARLLMEIINGIRQQCRPRFILGVRLSPERFGLELAEMLNLSQSLIETGKIDFLDISLWDTFKLAEDPLYQDRRLLEYFTRLPRRDVKLTVAGKLYHPESLRRCLDLGVDFVSLGRAGIIHHDYPNRLAQDENFVPKELPVTESYLAQEGLSEMFIEYMKRWPNFVLSNDDEG